MTARSWAIPSLLALAILGPASPAAPLRVSSSAASAAPDGKTWATAFPTLSAGLAAAQPGDELWASGSFAERITLPPGIAVYGGFRGAETARSQRDPNTVTTYLDAQSNGAAVTIPATAAGAVVDGLYILRATSSGILCAAPNAVIAQNRITSCSARGSGGGIACTGAYSVIEGNVVWNNAVQAVSSNQTYSGGFALGGGISAQADGVIVAGNVISDNRVYGGGYMGVTPDGWYFYKIDDSVGGGGLYAAGAGLTVRDNVVRGNSAWAYNTETLRGVTYTLGYAYGGGVGFEGSGTLESNLITYNASYGGSGGNSGGLFVNGRSGASTLDIVNNTIAANQSNEADYTGTLYQTAAVVVTSPDQSALVANNILALNNGPAIYADLQGVTAGALTFSRNDLYANGGNPIGPAFPGPIDPDAFIVADPLFVAKASGDYRLAPASPCVDAGADSATSAHHADVDGHPRIQGAHVDIGAYEGTTAPHTAARLQFISTPASGPAGQPLVVTPRVAVFDDAGRWRNDYAGPVTLAITPGSGAPGAALLGATTVNAAGGLADFPDVSVSAPGAGYALTASAPGLSDGLGDPFNAYGPAATISFLQQPAATRVLHLLAPSPVAAVLDAQGLRVERFGVAMALSIAPGTGAAGANLYGQTEAMPMAGAAVFGGLSIDAPGDGYVLRASAGSLVGLSRPFAVLPLLARCYVAATGGDDAGSGESWLAPKRTILGAQTDTAPDGEIWVAEGRYTQYASIAGGLKLYGGFAGGETDLRQRRPDIHPAVIAPYDEGANLYLSVGGSTEPGSALDGFVCEGSPEWNTIDIGMGSLVSHNVFRHCDLSSSSSNVRVQGNLVLFAHTGIQTAGAGAVVANNTVVGASDSGIVIAASGTAANNIIVGGTRGIAISGAGTPGPAVRNNLIFGTTEADPWAGLNGNISADPLFADAAGGNYGLRPGSPAIDAGDDSFVLPGELLANGSPRILGAHVDIGAFEAPVTARVSSALRALAIAAGLAAPAAGEIAQLDALSGVSPGIVDISDAVAILQHSAFGI
ncbi:MAG TPA: choice-of-anchor Q domain-containing protein [Armatimonadota bacterium]|jgi:hypothetical protein